MGCLIKCISIVFILLNLQRINGNEVTTEHLIKNGQVYKITWLNSNHTKVTGNKNSLDIYCHCGGIRTVLTVWQSIFVDLQNTKDFQLFEGENGTVVVEQYKTHLSSWLTFLPWRHSHFSIPAFQTHCVGVSSSSEYELNLIIRKINYWRILQMAAGAFLFLTAPSICRNAAFYYTSGISIGVFASLLIMLFLISRLMPRKTAAYSVILFGGSFIVYIFQKLWSNMRDILNDYSSYLIAYVGFAALMSFAICYRYQPMTDERSKNLIQWSFQIIGLFLVFFSSEFREFSMATVIVLIVCYNIPALWVAKARTWW